MKTLFVLAVVAVPVYFLVRWLDRAIGRCDHIEL